MKRTIEARLERSAERVHSSGEIYAPRFWVFDDEYLYGPSRGIRWPHDRPLESEIAWGGMCGVYAWKDLQPIAEWLKKNQTVPVIIGTVLLWGSIVEHGAGPHGQTACWRAQYGRVYTLDVKFIEGVPINPDREDDHIRRLRRNYGL